MSSFLAKIACLGFGFVVAQPVLAQEKITKTFGEKLEERRISEYADPGRSLFGRSVDLTIEYDHSASDFNGGFFASESRANSLGMSMAGGITSRLGYSFSVDRSNTRERDPFSTSLLGKQMGSSGGVGIAYSILPESARWPSMSASLNYSQQRSSGSKFNASGAGIRFSKNLESSAIFGGISMSRPVDNDLALPVSISWSGDFGVALVVNHRFSISGSVNVGKSRNTSTALGLGAGINYALGENLVVSGRVGTNLTGISSNSSLGVSLTRTFGGKL